MKRNVTPRLHCPSLIGPTDRLWLDLLAEAKAAGADLNAGEAAFLFTHDHEDDIPASSSGASRKED